jgi:hypothetical protein
MLIIRINIKTYLTKAVKYITTIKSGNYYLKLNKINLEHVY